MDLKDFFKNGFYLRKIDPSACEALLRSVRSTQFIRSEDYRDVGYKPPLIANWDDLNEPIVAAHNCNADLRSQWHSFRALLSPLESLYGEFNTGSVLVNKFPSGHGMNWHSDTVDTTFVQMLIYLSADVFTHLDGGYLQVSQGRVDNAGVVDKNTLGGSTDILPNNGTVVVMNNLVPTMVHRVEPLVAEKERLTVVFRYGYLANTLTRRRLQIMKGEIHA